MHIPYGVAVLLCQRGVTDKDTASAFLYPRLTDLLSPFLMKDMRKAVDLVMQAGEEQWTVLIHGDYDVDGISGTALLSLFFKDLNIDTICFQPNRLTEGYGLQKSFIERHVPHGNDRALLITVDCGISSHEEIRLAKDAGFRVIITDHHQVPEKLPEADAILNPQQADCGFPYTELAGVGVAFFLAMGVRRRMVEKGMMNRENAPNLKKLLSLVALGTVADVMPVTGINRILVKAGLEIISTRTIPWAWALCESAGLKEGVVTAEDISFRLAPRLNAPGRIGKPEIAFRFLTCSDTVRAMELADTLERINQARRKLEKEALGDVLAECNRQHSRGCQGMVVYGDYHSGIIGIIASRMVDRFHKPVFILTNDAGDAATLKGSGRSVAGLDLYAILGRCSDTIIQYGGHTMAAGLTIEKEKLAEFTVKFDRVTAEERAQVETTPVEEVCVDYCPTCEEIFDRTFINCYQSLGPFGNGNPEPVFLLTDLKMGRASVIHNHLKYTVHVAGKNYRGIGFGMADKLDIVQDSTVQLAFKLKQNVFKGEKYTELHAVDISVTAEPRSIRNNLT
jgi:single-stranded-DNA-specific exonuclease